MGCYSFAEEDASWPSQSCVYWCLASGPCWIHCRPCWSARLLPSNAGQSEDLSNCSGSEGGLVFIACKYSNGSAKVIWSDELNNNHLGGGYNHPGDIRQYGNIVVIAGQNAQPRHMNAVLIEDGHPYDSFIFAMNSNMYGMFILSVSSSTRGAPGDRWQSWTCVHEGDDHPREQRTCFQHTLHNIMTPPPNAHTRRAPCTNSRLKVHTWQRPVARINHPIVTRQ